MGVILSGWKGFRLVYPLAGVAAVYQVLVTTRKLSIRSSHERSWP